MTVLFIIVVAVVIALVITATSITNAEDETNKSSKLLQTNQNESTKTHIRNAPHPLLKKIVRTICGLLSGLLIVSTIFFWKGKGGTAPLIQLPEEWRVPIFLGFFLVILIFYFASWLLDNHNH